MPSSAISRAGSASPPSRPAPALPRSPARRSPPPRPLPPSPIRKCAATTIRNRFATGVIAAGGTLGAMLPPSTVLAVYGIITEQDIGKLFIAGIIPGLLAAAMDMMTVVIIGKVRPDFLPGGAAPFLGGAPRRPARHLGDAAAVRLRHRRALWRPVHADRGRRHGRVRRALDRRRARQADAARKSAARCCRRCAPPPPCSRC